jgi:DNA-binding transcriptional regulator YiaG
MTPAEALADIHGFAKAGRVLFTAHADIRAWQRGLPPHRVVAALTQASGCRPESGE